ncbi:glycosyltransferase family 2 protein [Adhaeribacter terreus]|uniref:Glycosyltransferase family 2 protein n=1 Tax=Adhaeribacter terreus TaxID=529703 RepID=A0ABW0EB17_9BACT
MEPEKIKFSIAIPAYKSIYLLDCIKSILNQNYKNFELIILNDCSPNPIGEIVQQIKDDRLIYLNNEINVGAEKLVLNWNKCLQIATGDYFIIMGDDDLMEPIYLDEFVKLIEKFPNLDVYHCRSKIIDENSKAFSLTPSWPEFETVYDNIWHRISGHRLQYISDFVYKTKTLKENNGFYYLPLAWASDDITAYIACGKRGIAHTNNPVFNYRQSRYTISSTGNPFLKMQAAIMEERWFNDFLKNEPINEVDRTIKSELKEKINKYIRNKKNAIIKDSLKKDLRTNLLNWIRFKTKYELSIRDLATSTLKQLYN